MENKDKFLIRIVYKSGYTHDFWVYEFEIDRGNAKWTTIEGGNKPLWLGMDDIAAVWQLESVLAEENQGTKTE